MKLIFLSLFILTGCTLSLNISDLNSVKDINSENVFNDKEAPTVTGVIIDGTGYGSLTRTPTFLWSAAIDQLSGLNYYEVAIGTSPESTDTLGWLKISDQNFHFQTGLSLNKGSTYFPKVRAVDKNGNVSSIIYGDGWIATTLLSFLQPVTSMITGESVTVAVSGGESPYIFADSGSGYMNTSTGNYLAPLNISPKIESITSTDSVGQVATAQVKIRAFENKDQFRYDTTTSFKASYGVSLDTFGGIIYSAGYSKNYIDSNIWIVRKSVDGGSTWTIIDEYQIVVNKFAEARSVKVDSSGNIYVIGIANDGLVNHMILRKSFDGGTSWLTVDDFQLSAGKSSSGADLFFDNPGNIYTIGSGVDSSDKNNWIVRKSVDAGSTWTTVDTFAYVVGHVSSARRLTIDINSNIFVGGYGYDSSDIPHWLVRKSSDGGISWSIVDDYNFVADIETYFTAITSDSAGNLYASGDGYDGTGKPTWIVRKSIDSGGTWTTIDSYQYVATKHSNVNGLRINSLGHIYSVGSGLDSSGWYHWLVRKSTDGGVTWSVLDDYQFVAGTGHNYANDFVIDSVGNLFTIGEAWGATISLPTHWLVRKSSNGGTSWSNVDDYSYTKGLDSYASSIAYDSNTGALYSSGYSSTNFNTHWIVRKSIDSGLTWTTIDDFQFSSGRPAANTTIAINNGVIYALGNGYDASNNSWWIVRKSTDNGASWITSDSWNMSLGAGRVCVAGGIAFDSSNNVYVAGYGTDASLVKHLIIRKSTNAGISWSQINDYQLVASKSTSATKIFIAPNNDMYVVGDATNASNSTFWIVRKSTDSGSTWNTIDSYQLSVGKAASAKSIYVKANGEVFVSGYAADASSAYHSVVRKSTDGGNTWILADDYQNSVGKTTVSNSITEDAQGNIFSGGYYNDSSNYSHWMIRKSSDGGATWVNVDVKKVTAPSVVVSVGSIIPCLVNQICVAGYSQQDLRKPIEYTVRILSP